MLRADGEAKRRLLLLLLLLLLYMHIMPIMITKYVGIGYMKV